MGKLTQITVATILAAFAGLAVSASVQAAGGGKTVCIKPHKKFLKTQCGTDLRRYYRSQTHLLAVPQGPNVNFQNRRILAGPGNQMNGGGVGGGFGGRGSGVSGRP